MYERGTRVIIKDGDTLARILDTRHRPGQIREYWVALTGTARRWYYGNELAPYWCFPGDEPLTEDAPPTVREQPAHGGATARRGGGYDLD